MAAGQGRALGFGVLVMGDRSPIGQCIPCWMTHGLEGIVSARSSRCESDNTGLLVLTVSELLRGDGLADPLATQYLLD